MAQPSSSHHDRDRHRSERSSHHRHHRTISSTTLLLILSMILAVLAVMLSFSSGGLAGGTKEDAANSGILSYLSPKRTQQLIARESAVALREAEVARREAEMLAGAPGGVIPSPSPVLCPVCPSNTVETVFAPVQTVIKEIIKEESLTPPGWTGARADEILERELRITERERDISRREESVNRREHDASRRESWIMEQLIALGNDNPQTVEEEYVYEPGSKRKAKIIRELPPFIPEVIEPEIKTVIQTETVTVPAPANTRRVAFPTPVVVSSATSTPIPKTTAVEIITEEVVGNDDLDDDDFDDRAIKRGTRGSSTSRRPPARWFGGW